MSDPKLFTIRGIQFGLYGSSYNHISDEYEWRFAIAWGRLPESPSFFEPQPGYAQPGVMYGQWRRAIGLMFVPWRKCFHWEVAVVSIEHNRPVMQKRVHGFRQWPVQLRMYRHDMGPPG
jgi:hypothetical protein